MDKMYLSFLIQKPEGERPGHAELPAQLGAAGGLGREAGGNFPGVLLLQDPPDAHAPQRHHGALRKHAQEPSQRQQGIFQNQGFNQYLVLNTLQSFWNSQWHLCLYIDKFIDAGVNLFISSSSSRRSSTGFSSSSKRTVIRNIFTPSKAKF